MSGRERQLGVMFGVGYVQVNELGYRARDGFSVASGTLSISF